MKQTILKSMAGACVLALGVAACGSSSSSGSSGSSNTKTGQPLVIESTPLSPMTDNPAHPYTSLLLNAAPDPDRAEPHVLSARGAPPSLVRPPGGCRFHPQCPHAMAVCAERVPPETEVSAGHASACWLHVTGLTAAESRPLAGRAGDLVSAPVAPDQGKET